MAQKILRVGSSAAVTIPKKSLKDLGLAIGDEVSVSINDDKKQVIIEPIMEVDKELIGWTRGFIGKYKKALDALASK